MNLLLIGQIKGAKVGTRKDKTTQQMTTHCEVIVQYEDHDKNGELVLSTETLTYDVSLVATMKDNVNKFIAVPMVSISTSKGTYVFQNEDMTYTFFETNPMIQSSTKEKKAS